MTKDEYVKTLEKYMADNDLEREDGLTYLDGIQDAVALARQLDEPDKVVIPEFIANDIKYHKKHGSTLRGALGSAFDSDEESNVYCWFFAADGDENVRKYISAWDNGCEVEKEKKYRVKLPGMIGSNGQQYISKSMDDKLFACAYRDYLEQEFTKEELEKFPNWVQQLEFEEVEDE
ncbi:DUF1642 domain-containing protein [Pediococcus pentosaceus]|uniref:DUF1642 domain-containing protein n=1 Tax=Pediococcus pentosaceus TaxID=1255 RepID=UPI001008DB8E|nr:DUF1642 domain-containing protein [Pediococcus pentosaceus]RXI22543.1 DUF1642 domain-containing protein [Pediococcus pentosaceus]